MPTHRTNANLKAELARGKAVLYNGVLITDPSQLPSDASMDATETANRNARLASIDAEIATLTARRAVVAAGP